jgi:ligand-binding SRPBCC domain-containing protein
MPTLKLETKIYASIEICFNLSCSIDFHQLTTSKTKEKAIAGVTSGLVKLNDFVTWEAYHFGIKQKLTSKITQFNKPFHFRDEQVQGAFKRFAHDHYFEQKDGFVLMKDVFEFQSPYGIVGKLFNLLVLKNYMKRFLSERNNMIKVYAESDKWKQFFS